MTPSCQLFCILAVSMCATLYSLNLQWKVFQSRSRLCMAVAPYKERRPQNIEGNFFVDRSCIDCDACRWICPSIYKRVGVQSAVYKQPEGETETLQALAAMIACPTGSIRTESPEPLAKKALDIFPAPIDSRIPGVYHLGYHAANTFGAAAYLVVRPDGQNVMIDTPRFNSRLAQNIEDEGGLHMMVITHKHDMGDHKKWKQRFPNMQRVMHRFDSGMVGMDIEVKLQGEGKWKPLPNMTIIATPGHTLGSICVLHGTEKESVLFTGDHLMYNPADGCLDGYPMYNEDDLEKQADSILLLAEDKLKFDWILPGHGRMIRFSSQQQKRELVLRAAEAFEFADRDFGSVLAPR